MPADPHLIANLNLGIPQVPGNIYYVSNASAAPYGASTAANTNTGLSPRDRLSTIAGALSLAVASRGDLIVVMPGHSESLSAVLTVNKIGVTILGIGNGSLRPQLTVAYAGDGMNVTAANVTIENLYFNEATNASATSNINVAAAGCKIRKCQFDLGANDQECITLAAAADDCVIEENVFNITANGPDAAIEVEDASVDNLTIKKNYFMGDSVTNAWDAAAINSTVAHTNIRVESNVFHIGTGFISSSTGSGIVVNNLGGQPYTIGNEEYIEASGGGDLKVVNVGAEGASGGGTLSETTTGNVFYVDSGSGTAGNDGSSPYQAEATIDAAVALCAANNGDMIVVMPGHSETLSALITVDVAGISIVGLGEGLSRPQITVNAAIDGISITAADAVIANLYFNEATNASATSAINVAAANVVIKNCHFDLGANDQEAITWASGANLKVVHNEFVVTADGPDAAIEIEGTNDNGYIAQNDFNGGNGTNAFDAAAINSTVAHTNLLIEENRFRYGIAYVVATSVSTTIKNNVYGIGVQPNAATPRVVYADNGSTIRDGSSPETPTTLADAMDNQARTGVGDTILLLPGTYTLAATLAVDIAAVRIGPFIDNGAFNVSITTGSDLDLITLTGANCEIWGLRLLGNAAQTTSPRIIDLDTGDFNRIHHCFFDCANVASLQAIDIASTASDTMIDHNYFTGQVTAVAQIVDLGPRSRIWDNFFDLQNTAPQAYTNDGLGTSGGSFLRNYLLGDGGARTTMIVPDSTTPVDFIIAKNIFAGTSSATPFGQDAEYTMHFIENYVANNAGGVLIDPVA